MRETRDSNEGWAADEQEAYEYNREQEADATRYDREWAMLTESLKRKAR